MGRVDVTYTEIARAESGRGELVLRERRQEGAAPVLELRANGMFVMDTRETSSELALARAALATIAEPREVVIGGLGLGYTLQAVLADPRVEHVSVVEVEEALIQWMRDGTVPHGRALLADRRVRIVNADLAMAVAEARGHYDVVLLDVDNGPNHLVHTANEALYQPPFLRRVHQMLHPGGILAVWSMDEAAPLQAAMGEVFEHCDALAVPVQLDQREEQYWLITGVRGVLGDSPRPR